MTNTSKDVNLECCLVMPGSKELVVSEDSSHLNESEQDTSDEHFSDASEGAEQEHGSPVTVARTKKVDNPPSHRDVSGIVAFEKNKRDATLSGTILQEETHEENAGETHTQLSIPSTVVEEVTPGHKSHGYVVGTEAYEKRMADASPDAIIKAPDVTRKNLEDISSHDDLADEFDDFEEGDHDDDFGAFDEGTSESDRIHEHEISEPQFQPSLPILSYENLKTREDVVNACSAYVSSIFPAHDSSGEQESLSEVNLSLLNERSQSLWAQLVAPPPLQPPNWVRSRIRRLFLVSLGVPVDLDEILPASKQKKLILPSVELSQARMAASANASQPRSGDVFRLKNENSSSLSVNSQGAKSEKRRRGVAAAPDFDLNAARLVGTRTDTALQNLTERELKAHIAELERLKQGASELLQYWLVQKDSASGDKEAFEEVIENLVKHAKKIRK